MPIYPMDDEDDEQQRVWYPYDGGRSLGLPGWEDGTILRDEELGDPEDPEDADARLTLERTAESLVLTCSLYGFLQQMFPFADEAAAHSGFDTAKVEMERLAELIPYEEDGAAEVERKARDLDEAARSLASRIGSSGGNGIAAG